MPHAAATQFVPLTLQITPRLDRSFATVATSGKVPLIGTEPVCGETVTDAGSVGNPVAIVMVPVTLHCAAAGQLIVMALLEGIPVPVSGAVCGEPEAMSENEMLADRGPAAVGLKVTTIEHELLGATVSPLMQVLAKETAKSPALSPVVVTLLEKTRFVVPVFVTVIVWGRLGTPVVWLPKARLVGESVTTGSAPPLMVNNPVATELSLFPERLPIAFMVVVIATVSAVE